MLLQKSFTGHRHYVQGVAWDPLGESILTQSTDRTMRVLRGQAAKQRSRTSHSDLAAAADFSQAHVVFKHVLPATCKDENAGAANQDSVPAAVAGTKRAQGAGDTAAKASGAAAGYIFQDESLNTFFRRLAFSPEGSFVVAPAASLGPLAASRSCAAPPHPASEHAM